MSPEWSLDDDQVSDIGNEFLYTGRRLDPETGLYQYRYRYYHAQMGRFVNRDPIGYDGGMNLYGYVDGMPAGGVDPLGLKKKPMIVFSAYDRGNDDPSQKNYRTARIRAKLIFDTSACQEQLTRTPCFSIFNSYYESVKCLGFVRVKLRYEVETVADGKSYRRTNQEMEHASILDAKGKPIFYWNSISDDDPSNDEDEYQVIDNPDGSGIGSIWWHEIDLGTIRCSGGSLSGVYYVGYGGQIAPGTLEVTPIRKIQKITYNARIKQCGMNNSSSITVKEIASGFGPGGRPPQDNLRPVMERLPE